MGDAQESNISRILNYLKAAQQVGKSVGSTGISVAIVSAHLSIGAATVKLVCYSFLEGGSFVFFLTSPNLLPLGRKFCIWWKVRPELSG